MQEREERYTSVLDNLTQKIDQLKQRANYIKVENGYTTEEYLRYKKVLDNRRRKRRLDCLTLLNTLGYSYMHNDYEKEFHYHNYPYINARHANGNIYPLI